MHVYVFIHPIHYEQDMIEGQFLSRVKQVWIQSSFSSTGCIAKDEKHRLPYYLLTAGEENKWIHAFPKNISVKWNAIKFGIWTWVADLI